jgi:hypothetical protein
MGKVRNEIRIILFTTHFFFFNNPQNHKLCTRPKRSALCFSKILVLTKKVECAKCQFNVTNLTKCQDDLYNY